MEREKEVKGEERQGKIEEERDKEGAAQKQ